MNPRWGGGQRESRWWGAWVDSHTPAPAAGDAGAIRGGVDCVLRETG